jgi:predicted RND superfamily exporter protein
MGLGITKHRFKVLFVMLAIIGGFLSNVPKITLDTTTEGFLHESDPIRIAYDKFRDQFGRDERIAIAIKTKDVFAPNNLQSLKALHTELKNDVPYLNDITSLVNARNTQGVGDTLIVEDLFEAWPKTDADIAKIKKTALENPIYKNLLISEDGTFTMIILESNTYTSIGLDESTGDGLEEFDEGFGDDDESSEPRDFISDEENTEMVAKVHEITEKYKRDGFEIYLTGSPSVTDSLKKSMKGDIKKFNALIILTIIILLGFLFRRISGVLFPLLTVILSVLSTVGIMAYFGTPIKIPTQILPSFLLAVGVGTSIHIMAIFFHNFDKYGNKEQAIAFTLKHSGLAIIMTSLTTAAGIGSFSVSSVAPVADLGMYGAVGVVIALIYSMVLLPTLIAIFPIKRKIPKSEEHKDTIERVLTVIADFSQNHAKSIVVASLLFMVMSIGAATQMHYSHNPLTWFAPENETRVATETIDKEMRGTISLELIIDTQKENGLYDIALLEQIEALSQHASQISTDDYFVGKVVSITDVIKEIHKALNENRSEAYSIAKDPQLIAQEILLFENSGSDDLEDFVDSQFSKARVTLKMPWTDAILYHRMLSDLRTYLDTNMQGVNVTMTGMIPLLADTITAAIRSAGESYILAFISIAFMMMILLASIKLGVISMIPNLFPVFFIMGMMVVFDIPFDLFTMLVGSIVLGMAVDDTVHFMHNFRRYYDEGKTVRESVHLTITGTGRAMLVTSIVLSAGFFVYLFASMGNLVNFGLLAGVAIIVALFADFVIAPALMALLYKNDNRTEGN